MTRRDTIIIAVLLNAGLLVVLFATSLKTEKNEEPSPPIQILASNQVEKKPIPSLLPPQVNLTEKSNSTDAVEQMIKQYTMPPVNSINASKSEVEQHFLADLQALGTNEVNSSISASKQEIVSIVPEEKSFKEITVKQGDVLERVARQHQTSVSELMKINHLTSSKLKIGQTLKIPTKHQIKTTELIKNSTDSKYYTVKAGDSPWTIAVKHHMKVEDLLKLNNLTEEKARRLKPGDQLRIE